MKSAVRLAGALALLTLVTGCWQDQPINNRFLVFSMAVDPAKSPDEVRWTFQMPTPEYLEGVGGGGGGGSSSATPNPFFDIAVRSPSFSEAIVKAENSSSRDFYMGQLQAVFISTDLSAPRLRAFLDEEGRTGELDHTEYLMAAEGQAAKVMATKAVEAPLPSLAVTDHFGCPGCSETRLDMPSYRAASLLYEPTDLALPLIEVTPGGAYTFEHVVIYRNLERVAILSRQATRGWAWLTNRVQKEALALPYGRGTASIRNISGRSSYAVRRDAAGRPYLDVHIGSSGTISGVAPGMTSVTPLAARTLALEGAQNIRDQVQVALAEAKKVRAEPFGIGPRIRVQDPPVFVSASRWRDAFRDLPVHIRVDLALSGTGART